MFTLFWAGDAFAPGFCVRGELVLTLTLTLAPT